MNAHKDALKSDRSPGILPAVCESVRFGSAGGSCSGPLWGWRCDCHCVAVTGCGRPHDCTAPVHQRL